MSRASRFAPFGTAAIAAVLIFAAGSTGTTIAGTGGPAAPAARDADHDLDGQSALDHIFVIMLETLTVKCHRRPERAIPDLARPYLRDGRSLLRCHPPFDAELHRRHRRRQFRVQDDNDQNVVNLDRKNLVDQLENHHVSWGAYLQTLPADKLARFGPTLTDGTTVSLYAKKHNPFVLFDDIKNNPSGMAKVKDYAALGADLNFKKAPSFVWISPNQCSDMHVGVYAGVPGHPETPCPYGIVKDNTNDAALKHQSDLSAKNAVTTITGSRAWTRRSAIIVVTDENDYTGNEPTGGWESATGCCDSPYVGKADPRVSVNWPGGTYGGGLIPAIVISASGPRHFVDHTPYNHYSMLTTIENNWHLGHLGHAGDTAGGVLPMNALFGIAH
ncbi:MAG: alkaline phosphatase family protein [Nakamurella sp.]